MAIDPKININENQVIFKRDVGHRHDGLTSNLIDYTKYSVFDFPIYPVASPGSQRRAFEENNIISFKSFIVSAVEERVLNPRGIRVQANAITANEIAANTITATELSANIVLINNIISSNNYVANTSGWSINSNGYAEFGNAKVRGNIVANAGNIGGILIGTSSISSSDYDATNGFAIYSNGFADFNEVSVRGEIVATSGSIADNFSIGNNVSIGSDATIGDDLVIGDNLYIQNFVRVNGPASSNVTVMKIRGFANLADNISNARWSLVIEGPNGTNKWEVRDDGQMSYRSQVAYSDIRLKSNIENSNLGLSFINDLRPISYNRSLGEDSDGIEIFKNKKTYGFIAQEVKEVYEKYTDTFEGWDIENEEDPGSYQKISYDNFISPIVKAIQELSEKIDNLEARLQALEDV